MCKNEHVLAALKPSDSVITEPAIKILNVSIHPYAQIYPYHCNLVIRLMPSSLPQVTHY